MTGFEIAVLSDGFRDYGVVGNDGSGILLRPPRACKRQVHQKCRLKVQTASVSGNQRAVATEPSFPRKWESRTRGLGNCFYPISFRADRSRFPPA
ncbi:hypothetical protein ACES7X_002302, partial [Neisseria gonorrhoeae]